MFLLRRLPRQHLCYLKTSHCLARVACGFLLEQLAECLQLSRRNLSPQTHRNVLNRHAGLAPEECPFLIDSLSPMGSVRPPGTASRHVALLCKEVGREGQTPMAVDDALGLPSRPRRVDHLIQKQHGESTMHMSYSSRQIYVCILIGRPATSRNYQLPMGFRRFLLLPGDLSKDLPSSIPTQLGAWMAGAARHHSRTQTPARRSPAARPRRSPHRRTDPKRPE